MAAALLLLSVLMYLQLNRPQRRTAPQETQGLEVAEPSPDPSASTQIGESRSPRARRPLQTERSAQIATPQPTAAQLQLSSAQEESLIKALGAEAVAGAETLAQSEGLEDERAGAEAAPIVFSTDRHGVKSAVSEIMPEFQDCYQGWLAENPALEGRMQVVFEIAPSARAERPSDEPSYAQIQDVHLAIDDLKHPMLTGCLVNLIQGMHFEDVDSVSKISYPIRLGARP